MPFVWKLRKIIKDYDEFVLEGTSVRCIPCNQQYAFRKVREVRRHMNSKKHTENTRGIANNAEFLYDLCFLFCAYGSKAIRYSQLAFKTANIHNDLKTIQQRFGILIEATLKLQTSSLSSADALAIIADVQHAFTNFVDTKGIAVKTKLENVLNKNPGYQTMRSMHENGQEDSISPIYCDYFKFTPLTSVDVERSFSLYKHMYRPNRSSLSAINAERILVIMMYAHAVAQTPVGDDING